MPKLAFTVSPRLITWNTLIAQHLQSSDVLHFTMSKRYFMTFNALTKFLQQYLGIGMTLISNIILTK